MGLDLTCLPAAALVRLLNSTRLGTVITERRLYRHRMAAGLAIGDERGIHLVRYARWLARRLQSRMTGMVKEAAGLQQRKRTAYHKHKDQAGQAQAEASAEGRDIGSIPPVKNPPRRERSRGDLRFFCEQYFPQRFDMPWSQDHLTVIAKTESAALRGGLFGEAMPRGSGKTSITEVSVIWVGVHAHHLMSAVLAAIKDRGVEILDSIKVELENNERLGEDFPEVCFPIRALEGITNRCAGQLCCGRRTEITWTQHKIVLPTIARSSASGVIIKVGGLTGADVRGMKHTRQDGYVVRPSFVMIDDPQTDATARSRTQNETREKLLQGAVLGMAGPGKQFSAVLTCTVIRPGDMADRILDRTMHPEWNGVRTKMVYAFPTNEKLWDEYARIRAEGLRANDGGAAATAFYKKNRKAMDEGAQVAWPANYEKDELSAIQHAMNLKLRDEAVFFAEYQNEPMKDHADSELLTADQIAVKVNGLEAGKIPVAANYLTLFLDPHDKLIWYALVAWGDGYAGWLVDYGAYPDQHRRYYTMRTAQRTLARACPGAGREGAILAALRECEKLLLAREYRRDDGVPMRIAMALVDSGWETDTVNAYVRSSPSAVLLPSKGVAVTASSTPWEERTKKAGQRLGHHWKLAAIPGAKGRYVQHDANYWKTFLHQRLAVPMGDPGCLSLYGRLRSDGQPANLQLHRMLADHLTAEYRVKTSGQRGSLDEWKQARSKADNHLLDCVVGCCVAASLLGIAVMGTADFGLAQPRRRRPRARQKGQLLHL
jgi:hypothetical protein